MKRVHCLFLLITICCKIIYTQNLPDNIVNANCYVLPPASTWSIKESTLNNDVLIQNYGPLTVGDIDGDGIIEIIGYVEDTRSTNNYESTGLKIFYYNTTTNKVTLKKKFLFADTGGSTSSTFGSMAIARYNNTGYIVVSGTDKYLYAYNPSGQRLWKSNAQYESSGFGTIVNIADFNNDGIPEVYTGNQIFSLSNGALLCDGGTANSSGVINVGHYTVAADMDGDGKLEIVAGTNIYKVTITNNSGTAGNSIGLLAGMQLNATLPTYAAADGATQVVDIDNDGKLEVVVTSLNSSRVVVYVWKPLASNQSYIMGSYLVPATTGSYYSIPMIGNLDDTVHPEITFITNGSALNMYALKFTPTAAAGSQISLKWSLVHTDGSGCTGATLFDFNQDGRNEIVYRDETTLRIIDGSNNPGANPSEIKATFNNVRSGTLREFPVIADIDGDGQAEIVATGWDNVARTVDGVASNGQNGYLRVFKTNGSAWAPARKVWNQYAYNAVNVNEDLTIPQNQFFQATLFPGKNGIPGDADDVRPYNNMMQQQTILSQDGVPMWLAANVKIIGDPVFSYNESTGKMAITLSVRNSGEVMIQNPFYITAYKNNVGNTTKHTHTYTGTIAINETKDITFEIPDYSTGTWSPNSGIIIRINDKGDGLNEQEVCDETNTRFEYYGILPTQIDFCVNDIKTLTCNFTLPNAANTYQWQVSTNNLTWFDIAGETTDSYTVPAKHPGIYYYRVEVKAGTSTQFSQPVRTHLRSCVLPVNHNISTMTY